MRNEVMAEENRQLRERLQSLQSRARVGIQHLVEFQEHLVRVGMCIAIVDLAELTDELHRIRTLLSREVNHVRP
jgi:hypothetical protein